MGGFVGPFVLGALHDALPGPACVNGTRVAVAWAAHAAHAVHAAHAAPPASCPSEYAYGTAIIGLGCLLLVSVTGMLLPRCSPEVREAVKSR